VWRRIGWGDETFSFSSPSHGRRRCDARPPVLSRGPEARRQAVDQGARLSINRAYADRGTTITAGDSSNGCYIIGGPSGEPPELKVYAYVQATKIPARAALTYKFTTPWDKDNLDPGGSMFSGQFSHGLFTAYRRQQAEIFNGPTGKQDYFTYRMLPTGNSTSRYTDGKYSLSVSVKVKGKTLSSRGAVNVAC